MKGSGEIFALARALDGILDQSYALSKPMVDDACRHPETVEQDELEHLFDAVLGIMNAKGKRLFNRLCKSFVSIYPECVSDYIRIERECYGDDEQESRPRTKSSREHEPRSSGRRSRRPLEMKNGK